MTFTPSTEPMTRRQRRQLEAQGLVGAGQALSSPPQADPFPQPLSPSQHTAPPLPAQPMSRRERKALEETGVIPIPLEYRSPSAGSALQDTSLLEATREVGEPPILPLEPLPPVFGSPPTSAGTKPVTRPAPEPAPGVVEQGAGGSAGHEVGHVTMATSSLILPVTPYVDLSKPISDTGEIIVTGQVTLPYRLSETGSIPALREDPDDDEPFDAFATGELAALSQPIRAVKAVSGQGDDSDIILVRKVRFGRVVIFATTVAALVATGAVALLVVALLTDVLVL